MRVCPITRVLFRYFTLIGLVVCFPTLRAANEAGTVVPSIVSPVLPSNGPKAKVQLPSERYHLKLDLESVTRTLPQLELAKVEKREPDQIGVNRSIDLESEHPARCFVNSDGTEVLVFAIQSQGAKRLRAHFESLQLAPGDELFVRASHERTASTEPYRERGPWGKGDFWSGSVQGDTLIVEYYRRGRGGSFRITEVSHIWWEPGGSEPDALLGGVLSCEQDASCFNDAGTATNKNAVGRIVFVKGGGSFVCTGTLLSDRAGDMIPYFLTANHCVPSQGVAESVETYWFYQTNACNSGILRSDVVRQTEGAMLLATGASYDFSFLELVAAPPPNVTFAGWTTSAMPVNTPVYGLHHPGGDVPPGSISYLRRAAGTILNANKGCLDLVDGYEAEWTNGMAEPGASGSGLWSSQGLIGVLSCGPANPTCSTPFAIYSKFSNFYQTIKRFLDPGVSHLANISTRLRVDEGNNAMIGGFIISGLHQKTAVIRALGPSLPFSDALANPIIDVHGPFGSVVSNDNWTGDEHRQQVIDNGLAPTNLLESALWNNLNPGAYTVVVRGANSGTGVGLFEVYDLATAEFSQLANISTRGPVGTGDDVMIAGTIVAGTLPTTVIARGIGPSLSSSGVANPLSDPALELRDGAGSLLASNDNWQDNPTCASQLSIHGLTPTDSRESAVCANLSPAPYTAILSGKNNSTGIGLVELYQVQ